MEESAVEVALSGTVMDSWRASIAISASVMSSVRPLPERHPSRFHMTGTPPRRTVRASSDPPGATADFEIRNLIGAGGMGLVYDATQVALDRNVALKTLAGEDRDRPARRTQLQTEALIAGQLDHPNIVPVYDLGIDGQGDVFYTMKQIRGRPWADSMAGTALPENLDIFLRASDAMAFAHSRGVIHRDLKPANIMVGEFGEVIVMDWGVACSVRSVGDPEALGDRSALCGTPAYMPPEMARGDVLAVGLTSDIYMLGAILYEVVEGRPPRGGHQVLDCVCRAAENFIEPPRSDDELTRVALKAMATSPTERFSTVQELQQAVREHLAHRGSLTLSQKAEVDLQAAAGSDSYELYAQAVFGFRQALLLWPENASANAGLSDARLAYAQCARRKGDCELSLSQLDPTDSSHAGAIAETRAEMDRRLQRRTWYRVLSISTGALAVLLLAGALAFGAVVRSKNLSLGRQKEEIAVHLEEVRRSDRDGLINLILANHQAGNHEAVVASALRLREAYDFSWDDRPDLAELARVSAWMDPYRGSTPCGVRRPRRMILSPDGSRLYVVGEDDIAEMDRPGMRVVRHTSFPEPSGNPWLVDVGSTGGLWCARGLQIFRHDGRTWTPAISLPVPSVAEASAAGLVRPDAVQISGLLVSRGETGIVVAVDGSVVVRLNLQNGEWRSVHRLEAESLAPTSAQGCRLRESPDGRWLAWRPGRHVSWINLIEVEPMRIRAYFFNRAVPVTEFGFSPDSGHLSLTTQGGTVFRPAVDRVATNSLEYEAHLWTPGRYDEWATPISPAGMAALSPDGRLMAMAGADGGMWTGDPQVKVGRKYACHVVPRNLSALAVDDTGLVYGLSRDGQVHAYDLRTFSVERVQTDSDIRSLAAGDAPDRFLALRLLKGQGLNLGILDIGRDSTVQWTHIAKTEKRQAAMDPKGQFVAFVRLGEVWVHDLQTGQAAPVFPPPGTLQEYGVRFTPDGEWLVVGADWSSMLAVLRRGTWEPVIQQADCRVIDVLPLAIDGRMKLFSAQWDGSLSRWDVTARRAEWTVRPSQSFAGSPATTLIAVSSPQGIDSLWFGNYAGYFERANPADGRIVETSDRWRGRLHRQIAVHPRAPFCAFLMPQRGGCAVLVSTGDLLPVSTDGIAADGCQQLLFNSNGSMLAVLCDGQMSRVAVPSQADCRRVEPMLRRLFERAASQPAPVAARR